MNVAGVSLSGVNRDGLAGGPAMVAIRPADFTVVSDDGENTVRAHVEIVEYRGREQAVQAMLADGTPLHLRTDARLAPGDDVLLRVPRDRVLVFAP